MIISHDYFPCYMMFPMIMTEIRHSGSITVSGVVGDVWDIFYGFLYWAAQPSEK